jgi:dTDP-4-dehydrorhamnose reductase
MERATCRLHAASTRPPRLAGEYAALSYASGALVIRSAGLYGRHGSASKGGNFVTRMLARAREDGAQLRMVADQRLSPTYTRDLAEAVLAAAGLEAGGVLHVTASDACSWYEFTEAIMEIAGIDVPIEPVSTTRTPGGADRPLNGVLARPRADAVGLEPLRHWREALADCMGSD